MILTPNTGGSNTATDTTAPAKSFPKVVQGPAESVFSNELVYKITDYTYKIGSTTINNPTTEQQVLFDADKESITWVFWVSGGLMDSQKFADAEFVIFQNRSLKNESGNDFTKETDKVAFKTAVSENGYLEATVETVIESGNKVNKLSVKLSKWLDGRTVYVEAYRGKPDHNPAKNWVVATTVKAQVEVLDVYWMNTQRKRITSTGYETDVFLVFESLGLHGATMAASLFDDDGLLNPSDPLLWNGGQSSHNFTVDNRKMLIPYQVEAEDSVAYANGHGDELDSALEVFVTFDSTEPLFSLIEEDQYAEITFTPDVSVTTYIANKNTVTEGDKSYVVYESTEKVEVGGDTYLIAECNNIADGTNVTFKVNEASPLLVGAAANVPLLDGGTEKTTFTATVNKGYAVSVVKLQEVGSAKFQQWNDLIDTETENETISELVLTATISSTDYVASTNTDLYSSVTRFEISTDGINKHQKKNSREARFMYRDSGNTLHYLTKNDFSIINWTTKNYIYPKNKGQLIDIRDVDNYSGGDVKYKFKKIAASSTYSRYYIDIDCLACLLGALIEEEIEDLRYHGSSNSAGGPTPSSSHWNGMIVDIGYLNINNNTTSTTNLFDPGDANKIRNADFDYDRQVKLNNALHKFGFSKYRRNDTSVSTGNKIMLTEKFKLNSIDTEFTVLPHARHLASDTVRHYHHLHISGLDISFFNVIE